MSARVYPDAHPTTIRQVNVELTAYDAVGLPARLTLTGTVRHDDTGIYLDTPTGRFRLAPDDLLDVKKMEVVA